MNVININNCFNNLQQDEQSDIQTLPIVEGEPSFILAALKPERKLGAHYHTKGQEIYHVLEGQGVMEIGVLEDGLVKWEESCVLNAGDVFTVPPNMVHRLANTGKASLKLVFLTSPTHLNEDRFFIH
ncbi:glucose-6-phosphate isomerase [Anaerotignum neopropionicum]|uniref:Glucose-6-phosphate isomerase n=1 Tax=Anaerotignum neopropionicum TaxID=36847 RepID=A0A136WFF5_9FIRM|nr:cupin domain-containing protein [Anaerotignum neopropionicum]KXL53089.1 glucose-6-phosphate isomerase [Anaerotignum neopropionicum]